MQLISPNSRGLAISDCEQSKVTVLTSTTFPPYNIVSPDVTCSTLGEVHAGQLDGRKHFRPSLRACSFAVLEGLTSRAHRTVALAPDPGGSLDTEYDLVLCSYPDHAYNARQTFSTTVTYHPSLRSVSLVICETKSRTSLKRLRSEHAIVPCQRSSGMTATPQ